MGLYSFGAALRRASASEDARAMFATGGRDADTFYRQRWSFDKVVRSTHGVNCTGSCSWKVYVKDGIIVWETQQTDYPTTGPDLPEYEPRGCPRGAAFSWYEYSPTRVRYPYVRTQLLEAWREAKKTHPDPVEAWEAIQADPQLRDSYVTARGRGGMVRASWEEATEIVAAANVATIKEYGPDRIAGFSVIPAMSMVSYGAGARFVELMGGVMLSFYDWYADLPVASPQVFGDQTDVPEAGDWYNADYLIMWGSNVPLTRTPDAHFMTEARYHGQKVVAVSPDFADNTKFADEWMRPHPGTDGAVAFAMGHVILNEFHVGKREEFFLDYMRRYTDSPFLIELERGEAGLVPGKFVTAADIDIAASDQPNPSFRPVVMEADGSIVDPGGTLADRYGEAGAGKWNLALDGVDPVLSVMDTAEWSSAEVALPRFDLPAGEGTGASVGAGIVRRGVPVRRVGDKLVTTVYDLVLANYGVKRDGLVGQWPASYEDASQPGTPAWAEEHSGVPAAQIARIGREFARSSIDSGGRSMIIMGAGVNHYFHADTIYRTFLALTTFCASQGKNGGGWAHYVGQEKLRPQTGWAQYAFALDWHRPARQMISTGFWYLLTDQWRYDRVNVEHMISPLARSPERREAPVDSLIEASQRGWMPSYPTFDRSNLDLAETAHAQGKSAADYIAGELEAGRLAFACTDPDNPRNFPRVLFNWRTNLLGSSAKGTEFFLRHMLGVDSDVSAEELAPEERPASMTWREEGARGKLDLMVCADFRNTSTTLHSDIVLPAATWYEKHDLSSTDMHPYIHSFNEAVAPPWEARTDFDLFKDLAILVSRMGKKHLGVRRDVVAVPLGHDTPDELTMAHGRVPARSECGWVPGVTMPKLIEVERDYSRIAEKYVTLGPLSEGAGMVTKGVTYRPDEEVAALAKTNGTLPTATGQRPALDTAIKAADAILALSGTSNGRLAHQGFEEVEKRTGTSVAHHAVGSVDKRITFADTVVQPQGVITSPEWSGSEHGGRRYSAFAINIETMKPFHTLTGRMHYYLDHDWLQRMGESMPIYRPPLDMHHMVGEPAPGQRGRDGETQAEVAVRYLTPHNKWAIHSQYYDNLHMLTLGRGGQTVWMSIEDAEKIGVRDNDWIEAYNRNGVVAARAIVSHRIPEGTVFMHHAQDRQIATPLSETTGRRGGTHNSLTRILLKPSHMAGGYGQFTYAFNYVGPTGCQRDEVTMIRRRTKEVDFS